MTPSPPKGGHVEQLLDTAPNDVPTDYAVALGRFCSVTPGVERGYICAVRIEREGVDPEDVLKFSMKLETPVSEPEDSREAALSVLKALSRSEPQLLRELGGVGVLADRAVPAWEARAVRVWPRAGT
jgi:hypothetical protein